MRKPKDSENFTCRMDRETKEILNKMSDETGHTKTVIVEKAIKVLHETYKKTGNI